MSDRGLLGRGSSTLRAALVLLLLVVIWAPDAFFGLGTYWHHDLRTHHYPWRVWAAASWLHGQLPLWCAGAANGYPLLADGQTGALYPPTMLLFALLPGPLAMAWSVLLHQWWAGLSTFLLARALGRSRHASLFAAVAFAFGGFFVTHTLYLGMQNSLAWLPFTLWAVVRAAPEPGPRPGRAWALVGLGLWMMAVAGHIQAAAFSWLLVGVVLLWRIAPARRAALPGLVGFTLAALGALCIASPQLVASLELSRFSMRDGGVGAAFAGIGSLPPWELINGVLPRFFGFERPADVPFTYEHRGAGYWGMGENHWEMAFYLGIPVVFFASWALWTRRGRCWWAIAAVAAVLMLGRFTPAWGLFRLLPGMGFFRFPVRFALWLVPALALLAAAGLDDLEDAAAGARWPSMRRWLQVVAGVAMVAVLGLGALHLGVTLGEPAVRAQLSGHFMAQAELPPPPAGLGPLQRAALASGAPEDPAEVPAKVRRILASLQESTSWASPQVLWPLLLVVMLTVGLTEVRRGRLAPYAFAMAATVLLLLDLYRFGGSYHPRVPSALAEAPPTALQHLEPDRDRYRVSVVDRRVDTALDPELASASLGLVWGLQDVIVTSPLLMVRNDALLARCGLDLGGEKGEAKVRAFLDGLPVASLLGLRWVLSTHRIEDPRLQPVSTGAVHLYRNLTAQPLATVVGCVRPVAGADEAFEALASLRPGHEAVVEPGGALGPEISACDFGSAPGTVVIVEHSDQRWVLRADMARAGLLVLAETWYPGWHAVVDGVEVPILRADLALRGVALAAGEHEVVFSYRPAWLYPTLVLMGLGLLGGAVAVGWRKRAA
ncbi:MAG: hypothetical protein ABIO70_34515 [Pseudomonadota bacterium]